MTEAEVRRRVRKQIVGAIREDLDGRGEVLMKEAWEDIGTYSEPDDRDANFATASDEMRRIIKIIEDLS